jgi:NAD(P)-dependent dehydrogenase (short-subunit alcohol dehydrogenase family)
VVEKIFADRHANLGSFGSDINAVVVGATGSIGKAFVEALMGFETVSRVLALSRSDPRLDTSRATWIPIDIEDEDSIQKAVEEIRSLVGELHLVIVASGVLHHGETLQPEKTWRALSAKSLEKAFRINAVGPILVAKHLLPLLARNRRSAFAALSARVGSISDNRLGGWHSYRASKAALNMLLKTLSIELMRVNPHALCVALHPGTVDSRLSKPFHANVPEGKLFPPQLAASHLLTVIDGLTPEQSGKMFAWDGTEIPF